MAAARDDLAVWRVKHVELPVTAGTDELRAHVLRDLGLAPSALRGFRVVKKALDARRVHGVHRLRFAWQVELVLRRGETSSAFARAIKAGKVERAAGAVTPRVARVHASLSANGGARVAVVGAGPAGLFAALVLARHGVRVVLVDRGSPVERRSRELVAFHRTRVPNPESNLLFGEGGAGTYSDGKLYTRVDDPLEHALLEELVRAGASEDILFDARAHIGTDRLHRILPALRSTLVEAGVELAWNARVDSLVVNGDRVKAIATTRGEIGCEALVLAPGHSARDTWAKLHAQGVAFEAKPFQLGMRVEHPQELVTRRQHGEGDDARVLGPASYALVCKAGDGLPAAFSFCMCPGGRIVASVNEPGYLCTNGMSNSKHSSRWANAALVVTCTPQELGHGGPFAGVELQRELEARFFAAGGSDYTAPAQRVEDFVAGRASTGELATSYGFGARPARLDELVPAPLRDALRRALARFDRSMPGFAGPSGLFVGVESRSSGPVRMPRDAVTRRARGFANLYPCGEGAGWAGGITSAALDGARSAMALLEHGV